MAAAPRALAPCLDGLAETVRRLNADFGVTILWKPMEHDLGYWEPATRTMIVNSDNSLSQQTWVLIDLWKLLNMGPQYTSAAEPVIPEQQRALRLVTTAE